MKRTRDVIAKSVFGVLISLLIVSCGETPSEVSTLDGSIILQGIDTENKNDLIVKYFEVSLDKPGHLAVHEYSGSKFADINGPIFAISPDMRQIAFCRYTRDAKGRIIDDSTSIIDLDTGKIRVVSPISYWTTAVFSPDSSNVAFTDTTQAIVYDCKKSKTTILRRPIFASYNDYGGLYGDKVYGFVGNIKWINDNTLYYEYLSAMPSEYDPNSPQNPSWGGDTYAIVGADGRTKRTGSVGEFTFGVLNSVVWIKRDSAKNIIATDVDSFISNKANNKPELLAALKAQLPTNAGFPFEIGKNVTIFELPDGARKVLIGEESGRSAWYLSGMMDTSPMQLGTRKNLSDFYDGYTRIWSADKEFLILYGQQTKATNASQEPEMALYLVPLSREKPIELDLSSVPGYRFDGSSFLYWESK